MLIQMRTQPSGEISPDTQCLKVMEAIQASRALSESVHGSPAQGIKQHVQSYSLPVGGAAEKRATDPKRVTLEIELGHCRSELSINMLCF